MLDIHGRETGASMADLLVGMVLSGVVVLTIAVMLVSALKADAGVRDGSDALASLRNSTQRLTSELREARRIYTDSTYTRLHFWVDKDGDGAVDAGERVVWNYDTSAGVLTRAADDAAGSYTVASDVIAATPFLYSRDGMAATPADATLVTVELAVDIAPDDAGTRRDVRTEVRVRNVA